MMKEMQSTTPDEAESIQQWTWSGRRLTLAGRDRQVSPEDRDVDQRNNLNENKISSSFGEKISQETDRQSNSDRMTVSTYFTALTRQSFLERFLQDRNSIFAFERSSATSPRASSAASDADFTREGLEISTIIHTSGLSHLRFERSRITFVKEMESKLGSGGQGVVYQGILQLNSTPSSTVEVAVKVLKCGNANDAQVKAIVKEISTWSTLSHRHLLPLVGFCYDGEGSDALIMSEYHWEDNICKFLSPLRSVVAWRIEKVLQILAAVAYLHEQNVCHSDIKGENVLTGRNGDLVLCDFGLARMIEHEDGHATTGQILGTTRWSSPELLLEGVRNFPTDVWSWGCLFAEMMTTPTRIPYHDIPDRSVMAKIVVQGSYRWPYLPSELNKSAVIDITPVVEKCWRWEPRERPTIIECTENVIRLFDRRRESAPQLTMAEWKRVERMLQEAQAEYKRLGSKYRGCASACASVIATI